MEVYTLRVKNRKEKNRKNGKRRKEKEKLIEKDWGNVAIDWEAE